MLFGLIKGVIIFILLKLDEMRSQPVLVVSRFSQRFVQLRRFVTRFLINFQEPDSQSRSSEHGNLEFQTDGRFDPGFVFLAAGAQQYFALQEAFEFAIELFDSPHDSSVLGFVLGPTHESVGSDSGGVFGRRYLDHHVGGAEVFVVDRFEFDSDLKFVGGDLGVDR